MDNRLTAITGASAHIFGAETLEEMLKRITDEARAIVGAHQSVTSLTRGADWSQAIAAASLSQKYAAWQAYDEKSDGTGIYANVCRGNRPMRLTQAELEAHPAWRGFGAAKDRHPPMRGWLAAPLVARDGANLGLIQLSDKLEGEFDAGDEAVLVHFAGIAALAIENRQLLANARAAEKRFHEFAEIASDILWETDESHRCTFISARGDWKMAHPLAWYIGKTRWESIGADPASPAWRAHIADLDAHRPVRGFEYEARLPDDHVDYLQVHGQPQFDAAGKFRGYRGVTTAVTAARRAEAEARANEERFRDFVECASDWLWETGPDHRFACVLQSRSATHPLTPEHVVGRTRWELAGADMTDPRWAAHRADHDARRPFRDFEYDYVLPDGIRRHVRVNGRPVFAADGAFRGYRGTAADIAEQLESERKLRAAREMNEKLFESSLDLICITDRKGNFLQVNPGTYKQLGYGPDEIIGFNAEGFIDTVGLDAARRAMRASRESRTLHTFEIRCRRKDGRMIPVNWSVAWSEREQIYFLIGRDMTERVEAQERLNRSQRLEAIGQLTGGIAHDFNNLLTVIMGNSELIAQEAGARDMRRHAELSLEASRRAADLTAQLLAFARRQPLAPKAIDANKLIRDMQMLIRRTLGANVDLKIVPAADLRLCKADPTQLETALLNLAINARDAMPSGGTLVFTTSNRAVAAGDKAAGDLAPGDYVAIEVADTGTGMPPEIVARVFEPFFTTKAVGKGSGLGLARVYGFVKQSGGHIAIASEPGRGTTFTLFLPRAAEGATAAEAAARSTGGALPRGSEAVLVVEDDAAVRDFVTERLRSLGYRVLIAENGPSARAIVEAGAAVDLLFTDLMMPGGLSGLELAREARALRPGLKVLFTSGYSDIPRAASETGFTLLRKPYLMRDLARSVRQALDAAA